MAMITAACGSGGSSQPTTGPTRTPTSSVIGSPPQPIIGTWRSEYTCGKLVQAYEQAGVGELAADGLVALRMQPGPADGLVNRAKMCAGAEDIQRTQIFLPDGWLHRYQGETLVDDCRCYQLIGGHTFVVLGDANADPDISLAYRIDGETLTFHAVMPDKCSSAKCRGEFAFAVGTYTVGSWHRVDS